MASKGFNYSKWDKIELSDDESDVHPNIDKDSWFRMKHRTRLEREAKEDEDIKKMVAKNTEDQGRINIITAKLNGVGKSSNADDDAAFDDLEALEDERKELLANIESRNKKINDITERRKWNIDNICKTKEEKTFLNSSEIASLKAEDFAPIGLTEAAMAQNTKTASNSSGVNPPAIDTSQSSDSTAAVKKSTDSCSTITSASTTAATTTSASTFVAASSTPKSREKFAMMAYNDYALLHEALLEEYSVIEDMEKTSKVLFSHCDILLHEHAQSYLLLACLEDAMNGKMDRLKIVCRQSQILSHITELGVQMHRDPRDVILPFFRKMEDQKYFTAFLEAVDDFRLRIIERAKVKRAEMDKENKKKQLKAEEAPLGPGGLNPVEVFESLPESLQAAFESQSVEALQKVISEMAPADAKYHMKRCIDSGLWVAKDPTVFDDRDGDDDGERADTSVEDK